MKYIVVVLLMLAVLSAAHGSQSILRHPEIYQLRSK